MKKSALAARRQQAIERIKAQLAVDFSGMPKAPDVEHRQLFQLERIADALEARGVVEVDATDAAKELAIQHGLNIADVQGSGTDGRILKSDVEALVNDGPDNS